MENKPYTAFEWDKNKQELMRVTLTHYKNRPIFDMREYFKNKQGEWQAGRKGITLSIVHLDNAVAGLLAAQAAIREGWE